jgi:molecular chaperone DnaK (HSP70)
VQTIQLTAQVDADGVLRVRMPEGMKNTTVEATIVFTAAEYNSSARIDRSNPSSLTNLITEDSKSWVELVQSLSGAWTEDFPSLAEIRTGSLDIERESL